MQEITTAKEVLEIVKTGNFDNLIGIIENEVIEFKGAPYNLGLITEKFELAKDVASLANVRGGIIVLGVKTILVPDHPYEEVDKIRAFEQDLVSVERYQEVVRNWIYPGVHPHIDWVPLANEPKKGVVYIFILEEKAKKGPFLVSKSLIENEKVLGNVYGFFQRRRAKIEHVTVEEMHHRFKDGSRYDSYLAEINENVSNLINMVRVSKPEVPEKRDVIMGRIENCVEIAQLADSIPYIFNCYPLKEVEISLLFERRNAEIVRLIEHPPELRYAGFDLDTGGESRIVGGEARRCLSRDSKILEVWRDGTIIFATEGDGGFLCWGDYSADKWLRVNPIALIESTYLFANFVKRLYEIAKLAKQKIRVSLELRNIPSDRKYGLPRGAPGRFGWDRVSDFITEQSIHIEKEEQINELDPEIFSYEVVAEFYAKSGIEHEYVPYTKEENGRKAIDVGKIRNIR